ncbi:hypothetical protein ACFL6U_00785 [Planctomycetota bacterium]
MRPKKLDKFLLNLETEPTEGLNRRIAALIGKAAKQSSGTVFPAVALWRRIMLSKMTKVAAVIAIVVVCILAFNLFDRTSSVTWAGVIEPLLKAQTVAFDVITSDRGMVSRTRYVNQEGLVRSRQEIDTGVGKAINIFDFDRSLRLTLSPEKKVAFFTDVQTESPTQVHIGPIRELVTKIQEDPDFTIEQLDDQVIEGQSAIVFKAVADNETLTVWADAETLIPIRLEKVIQGQSVVLSNIRFDYDVDLSLFSMDAPDGYSTVQGQLDLTDLSEKDLLEGLRVWAQIFGDGQFPPMLTSMALMMQIPAYKQRLAEGTLVLTEQQKLDAGNQITKLMTYIGEMQPQQDWHYVGASILFGDTEKPIFWYKPIDSETYRVIYGDLCVKDVSAEELPR